MLQLMLQLMLRGVVPANAPAKSIMSLFESYNVPSLHLVHTLILSVAQSVKRTNLWLKLTKEF